jgi:hypothetical protein
MKGFTEKAQNMLREKDSQLVNVTFGFKDESQNYSLGFLETGNRGVLSRHTLGKYIPNKSGKLEICISLNFCLVDKEAKLAKLLSETVSKMVETLEHIVENEELNDNVHGWINNDLDYVQVNFFRTPPNGDYQHEVRTETGISALDAINLLSVRIENTINSI